MPERVSRQETSLQESRTQVLMGVFPAQAAERGAAEKYGVDRSQVTRGPGSRATGLAMAFKLIEAAQDPGAVNGPHLVALVRDGARSPTADSWNAPTISISRHQPTASRAAPRYLRW